MQRRNFLLLSAAFAYAAPAKADESWTNTANRWWFTTKQTWDRAGINESNLGKFLEDIVIYLNQVLQEIGNMDSGDLAASFDNVESIISWLEKHPVEPTNPNYVKYRLALTLAMSARSGLLAAAKEKYGMSAKDLRTLVGKFDLGPELPTYVPDR